MDQAELLQLQQGCENLLRDGPDVLQRQRLELVVLEEVVQVLLEHLKHKTGVVLVSEALVGPDEVELVGILLAQSGEDADLDLALPGVGRVVLQDLDGHDLVGALLPTFGNLAEGASAKKLQHLILKQKEKDLNRVIKLRY